MLVLQLAPGRVQEERVAAAAGVEVECPLHLALQRTWERIPRPLASKQLEVAVGRRG